MNSGALKTALVLSLAALVPGCVRAVRSAPPSLYSEFVRGEGTPSAYTRPHDELERPAKAKDAATASHHSHGAAMPPQEAQKADEVHAGHDK